MKSSTTELFWEFYSKLPLYIKKKAREAFKRFQENPYHAGLRFKRIHSTSPIFSVRITKDYRALGIQQKGEIIWFWIGNHAQYNKLLKQIN